MVADAALGSTSLEVLLHVADAEFAPQQVRDVKLDTRQRLPAVGVIRVTLVVLPVVAEVREDAASLRDLVGDAPARPRSRRRRGSPGRC